MNRLYIWLTLFEKDSREFFASKSWIIVLILPLFITFLYTVVYREAESKVFTIAYPLHFSIPLKSILTGPHLKLQSYQTLHQAKKALYEGRLDGVILNTNARPNRILLLIDKSKTKETSLVIDAINLAFLRAYTQNEIPQLQLTYINQSLPLRWLTLPVWLIQIILTVCLLQAAAAVADEKDKQTFHSLLVSPITVGDYLLEKIFWNMIVGIVAVLITLFLVGVRTNYWIILVYGFLGCTIYSAISILIGLLTPGTMFARTLATLTYIISSIPIMIKDLSLSWNAIFNLFPSHLILSGFEHALTPQPFAPYIGSGIYLFGENIFLIVITYVLLRFKTDF